jgi:hypothetical protein
VEIGIVDWEVCQNHDEDVSKSSTKQDELNTLPIHPSCWDGKTRIQKGGAASVDVDPKPLEGIISGLNAPLAKRMTKLHCESKYSVTRWVVLDPSRQPSIYP